MTLQSTPGEPGIRRHSPNSGVRTHPAVDRLYDIATDAFRRLDPRAARMLFAPGALFLPSDARVLQGTAPIGEWFGRLFDEARRVGVGLGLTCRIDERGVQNDVVYDVGQYLLVWRNGLRELPIRVGRFAAVFRRDQAFGYRVETISASPLVRVIPTRSIVN